MNDHNCYVYESGLRNVLDILVELAHNDTETDVFESNIISQSVLPKSEVQIYLNELESRRFAEGSTT